MGIEINTLDHILNTIFMMIQLNLNYVASVSFFLNWKLNGCNANQNENSYNLNFHSVIWSNLPVQSVSYFDFYNAKHDKNGDFFKLIRTSISMELTKWIYVKWFTELKCNNISTILYLYLVYELLIYSILLFLYDFLHGF